MCESAGLGWKAVMGGEEARRRGSTEKAEKGKVKGRLMEALGCRLKESVRTTEWKRARS